MSSCEGCSSLPLDFACWWPKGIWRPCDDHVRGRYACSTGKSGILHVDEWEPCYKLDSRFHGANVWPTSPDWAHVAPILSSRTWWPHVMESLSSLFALYEENRVVIALGCLHRELCFLVSLDKLWNKQSIDHKQGLTATWGTNWENFVGLAMNNRHVAS